MDKMDDPIKLAEKQAQRYWYVDGLSEIAAGGVFLAAFGLGWLVIGAWALRSYLASTRPAGSSAGEE